jgi:hypothetical protein
LTAFATHIQAEERNALLLEVAEALNRPALSGRLKLIGFVQALVAFAGSLSGTVAESVAIPLIAAAHADDPTERLAALRSLAVLASKTQSVNSALTHSILETFEQARMDSFREIRALANEILAAGNPVFRRLHAMEAPSARR